MEQRFTKIDTRVAFEGRVFDVHVDRVRLPNERVVQLEVVRHPRSVVLLPVTGAGEIVLVRQYRYAVDRWLWELPAGSLEPGEEPEAAARRECHEEIGKTPARVERLAALLPTPGFCDEEMIFYRLEGLSQPEHVAAQDEDELLEPRAFPIDELRAMIARGEVADMKTVVGVMLITGNRDVPKSEF